MGTNGNPAGQGGSKRFILVGFLALAIGAAAVYAFSSSSSGGVSDTQQADTVQAGQEQTPSTTVQNQPSDTVEVQADTNGGVNASTTIVATDDPVYMDCLNQPNAEGETNDQHIAKCNALLEEQQAQQETQNGPTERNPGPSPSPVF